MPPGSLGMPKAKMRVSGGEGASFPDDPKGRRDKAVRSPPNEHNIILKSSNSEGRLLRCRRGKTHETSLAAQVEKIAPAARALLAELLKSIL